MPLEVHGFYCAEHCPVCAEAQQDLPVAGTARVETGRRAAA
jgi:hypothetical protein